ncbi:hypothetical protein LY76DRAFT_656418 [Colletotrichum caudatum]|nr:hypothetical protein LY76DRAFT_656418 [Colletotrichum caudatum]
MVCGPSSLLQSQMLPVLKRRHVHGGRYISLRPCPGSTDAGQWTVDSGLDGHPERGDQAQVRPRVSPSKTTESLLSRSTYSLCISTHTSAADSLGMRSGAARPLSSETCVFCQPL